MPHHAGLPGISCVMDPHKAGICGSQSIWTIGTRWMCMLGDLNIPLLALLYAAFGSRYFDLGYLNFDEPFKKLINQGKSTGTRGFVYTHPGY